MAEIQFANQAEANKAFLANVSPRYLRLEGFEKWVDGRQYDGKVSWWDDSVPLWERAPVIVYPVVSIAASSYVDLLLGNGRYPEFSTKVGEDESDEENGLSEEESAKVDRFIREYHKVCRFRAASRDAVYSAQGCGSVCEIHGARNGRPFVDNVPAKWCEPKLDAEGAVESLEIRYPYFDQYKDQQGKWAVRTRIYRRVVDKTRDVEYLPAEANENGTEPSWRENKDRTVEHGLGYCPVVWYPFMRGCVPVNEIDGRPIHLNITDEIHQHDIARSQWHRGALMSEPQVVETGVDPDHNPTEPGRPAVLVSTEHGGPLGPHGQPTAKTGAITGGYQTSGPKTARKKGPGYVWRYTDPATKVQFLTYPGDALKAQEDNCRDLRIKLQEALAVVFLDPESIKFAATTSGKALEAIKQKQLDRCDQIRDDLTDRFFDPTVSMQLRIAHTLMSKGLSLKVPGAKQVKPILDKFVTPEVKKTNANGEVEKDAAGKDVILEPAGWQIPTLQVRWGTYFKPDADEQKKIVEMVLAALEAGVPILTVKVAIQKLAPIFGIENVTAFMETLEEERLARQQEADERAANSAALELKKHHDMAKGLVDEDDAAAEGSRGTGGEEPPSAPRSRKRRAPAAAPEP